MAASKSFSVRLSPEVERWIEQEARRLKRSKGSILDSLADEAIRMRRFPGLGFRGDDHDRRAWVVGSGWDVWEIIQALKDNVPAKLVEHTSLTDWDINLAQRYYACTPDDVNAFIAENQQPLEYWQEKYPSLQIHVHEW